MKTLVVYYSLEGNTDYTAQMIASKTGGDLERLKPENEPPKNFLKFLIGGRSAIQKEKAVLNRLEHDPADYDQIVVATPVWAGRMTPAIREFLVEHPFEGKKAAIVVTSASGKGESAVEDVRTLLAGNEITGILSLKNPLKYSNKAEVQINHFVKTITEA